MKAFRLFSEAWCEYDTKIAYNFIKFSSIDHKIYFYFSTFFTFSTLSLSHSILSLFQPCARTANEQSTDFSFTHDGRRCWTEKKSSSRQKFSNSLFSFSLNFSSRYSLEGKFSSLSLTLCVCMCMIVRACEPERERERKRERKCLCCVPFPGLWMGNDTGISCFFISSHKFLLVIVLEKERMKERERASGRWNR